MARCTECGAAVADDLKFCGYCGAKLNIVSEHLGTQILGNTQVILDALDRIAPGAAQQYEVLGSVTSGPMAGGILLFRGGGVQWSDGRRVDPIENDRLVECLKADALEWNPDLNDRCSVCLTLRHRTRSFLLWNGSYVPGGPERELTDDRRRDFSVDWGPAVAPPTNPAAGCPVCAARYILEHTREWYCGVEWQDDFAARASELERGLAPPYRASKRRLAAENRQSRDMASTLRRRVAAGADVPPLATYRRRELAEFQRFADSLGSVVGQLVRTYDEHRAYQLSFLRAVGPGRVGWRTVPQSLLDDERALRQYELLWRAFDDTFITFGLTGWDLATWSKRSPFYRENAERMT